MISKLSIYILLLITTAFIVIAFILSPESFSYSYWGAVSWILFLISINWYTSAKIFTTDSHNSQMGSLFGSLPSISIVVLFFSLISIIVLVINMMGIISNKIHFVMQVIICTITLVLVILLAISSFSANHNGESGIQKSDIINELKNIGKCIGKDDEYCIDGLLDSINNEMSHPSKLDQEKLRILFSGLANSTLSISERIEFAKEIIKL